VWRLSQSGVPSSVTNQLPVANPVFTRPDSQKRRQDQVDVLPLKPRNESGLMLLRSEAKSLEGTLIPVWLQFAGHLSKALAARLRVPGP